MSALTEENDEDTEVTPVIEDPTENIVSDNLSPVEIDRPDRHYLGVASLSVLVFYSVSGESNVHFLAKPLYVLFSVFSTCIIPCIDRK
mmetsp:Transcript_16920/g.22430  ORF Transcript_16920/g.22430 Transcript_16920/m.22430 type:complete len:88 (-) Transcript_16920:1659-1922(-)